LATSVSFADDPAKIQEAAANHWSFKAPVRPDPPQVKNDEWANNAIDRFVLARLEKENLAPSEPADRETLIRRVTLDLIGLPPSVDDVERFLADDSPGTYERLVDRLLSSPRYGEHWAKQWLDLARYADTNGYEKDRPRVMWRYRDWVIDAVNNDMPFDQFTVEQIAGDMLPDATQAQHIATGFHRNTMANEEGGVDAEQFRFESVIDRVNTTSTVFMGLGVGCAQCHTHKFDPITHKDYWQLFAVLNNADEPTIDAPTPDQIAAKAKVDAQVAELVSQLDARFPLRQEDLAWKVLEPVNATAAAGTTLTPQNDYSLLATGQSPSTEIYTVEFETPLTGIAAVRLETLTDPSLPKTGPGRADNGNFVLTEFSAQASPLASPLARQGDPRPLRFANAWADVAQKNYPVWNAIDGDAKTSGWAVDDGSEKFNQSRTAVFETQSVVDFPGGTRLKITLAQNQGGQHTLGRFRIAVGTIPATGDIAANQVDAERDRLREKHLADRLAAWASEKRKTAAHWQVLDPKDFVSKGEATMRELDDHSILVTGNRPTRDTYTVTIDTDLKNISAIRLEALTDPRIPFHGPGRGTRSDQGDGSFMLTEFDAVAYPQGENEKDGVPIKFVKATADYAGAWGSSKQLPEHAIDGDRDSGWSIAGSIGQDHAAVFDIDQPIGFDAGTTLKFILDQQFIDQHTLGRFRLSATTQAGPVVASGLMADLEAIVIKSADQRSDAEKDHLKKHFLTATPLLGHWQDRIDAVRKTAPTIATAMILQERDDVRQTHLRLRGEFLNKGEPVTPAIPAMFKPLADNEKNENNVPPNRLTFAQWLVDGRHPLTARVAVNRMWQRVFGRGLVTTPEDFGTQGAPPSHPELLDWLATEFVRVGWSGKAMHRLIVTSATYQQSSQVQSDLLARDPDNALLARGPRVRFEAEVVRDGLLSISGLLTEKLGGPSVFPPQPEGVIAQSYGGLAWNVSPGGDRYRRGLYTFWKRTSPYAGMVAFDAPSRELCTVRRPKSNTPMQALTLLNDPVFVECAQALANRILNEGPADAAGRIAYGFRLCVTRSPQAGEIERLAKLLDSQRARFANSPDDAVKLIQTAATPAADVSATQELAAWTVVSTVLLNLDETITKG
jgi:hypothetical protein